MNGRLVPLFVKVLGYASGSKKMKDAVERIKIISIKLHPQPD